MDNDDLYKHLYELFWHSGRYSMDEAKAAAKKTVEDLSLMEALDRTKRELNDG